VVKEYREKVKDGNVTGFLNRARAVSMFLIPLFVRSLQSPESFFEDEEGDERRH